MQDNPNAVLGILRPLEIYRLISGPHRMSSCILFFNLRNSIVASSRRHRRAELYTHNQYDVRSFET